MMLTPQELRGFLEFYEAYVKDVLFPTQVELKRLLREWRSPEFWGERTGSPRKRPSPSPLQRAHTRIKRPESVVDKILRKPASYPDGVTPHSVSRMTDLVGGRVVLYFLAGLPLLDGELRRCEQLELSSTDPPVAYLPNDTAVKLGLDGLRRERKESGYTSVHYIARFRTGTVAPDRRPWFELQVRTLAEDIWAEIEHVLGYKPEKRTSAPVREQFRILGQQLDSIDAHFDLLSTQLTTFQDAVIPAGSDPLNAENLAAVLAEAQLGCAQQEVDGMLKLLYSRGIRSVDEWRRTATAQRLVLIRSVYLNEKRRAPTNFEYVANIGTLSRSSSAEEEPALIRAHIAFLDAWDSLRNWIK